MKTYMLMKLDEYMELYKTLVPVDYCKDEANFFLVATQFI